MATPSAATKLSAATTLGDLARLIGATSIPRAESPIEGISALSEATAAHVSFCADGAHAAEAAGTKAAAVIVPKKLKLSPVVSAALQDRLLAVDDVDQAVRLVLLHFAPEIPRPPVGVDGMSRVDGSAVLGEGCRVGPFVVVGARTRLGRNCVLHPGVVVGEDVVIGDDCELFANVVVRERCTLGNRVVVYAGAVIGSDGFGYRWDGKQHAKVPQIGTVIIGDDVEIGSCTCIDRAKFSTTVVGPGTKIDNLVQIAHNVRIGAHCLITAQCGMAGSVTVGNGVVMGGQSAIRDHVQLGDQSMIAACSAVAKDVEARTAVSGLPALPHRQSLREQAALRRLPELVQQVRKLQDEVEKLSAQVSRG